MILFSREGKLQYIKRTGVHPQFRYWYWLPSKERIATGGGRPRPEALIRQHPQYAADPWEQARPLQVGDVVFHWPQACFGVLAGRDRGLWWVEARTGDVFRGRTASFTRVWSQLAGTDEADVPENLIGARSNPELAFAEELGVARVNDYIETRVPNIPISEPTLRRLHGLLFGDIYSWAGGYREEEVVVGAREWPVLAWEEVPERLNEFFQNFYTPTLRYAHGSRGHLIEAITELHAKLAWIHPFQDGNGRVIRYLCEILALEWGYWLEWPLEPGRRRKRYHRAVRLAAQRNNRQELRTLVDRGTTEIG